MAFTTSQQVDTILLRGLNFRYNNNAAPSTFFTIYANGNGQTYWSNSITTDNLSTLSTSLDNTRSTLSTSIQTLSDRLDIQSTQISTIQAGAQSTTVQLLSNQQNLSNSVNILSNTFVQFAFQTNVKLSNYDIYISTTVDEAISNAIQYISVGGAFFDSLSTVQSTLQVAISSLSTTIVATNSSLYSTVTFEYQNYVQSSFISTTASLSEQLSEISTSVILSEQYGPFSTFMVSSLISSSQNLAGQISSLSTYTVSTINKILTSSFQTILTTLDDYNIRIFDLEQLSTNLSSITNVWISTSVGVSESTQRSTFTSFYLVNSTNIFITQNALQDLQSSYSSFSSFQTAYNSTNTNQVSALTNRVSTLEFQVYLISVSSILVNIWSSFYNLELYTSTIIGQRFSSITQYETNVYQSTVAMNISTSASYFDFYVSTLYASTLSTLIPSTMLFTSSMVSTLFSTSYNELLISMSTLVSTQNFIFISTSFGLNSTFISTNAVQMNSSVLGYLSVPAASTFANISTLTTSTFNNINSSNARQSTIFFSTNIFFNSVYSSLFVSTAGTNASSISTLNSLNIANSTLLSTASASFNTQLNTQSSIFSSTLTAWNTTLNSSANNAFDFVVTSTVNTTSTAAGIVTVSTVNAYNIFISSLGNQAGQIGVSTLYTASTLLLTGNTRTQLMDLTSFRNFVVFISSINDGGVYRLSYNQNTLLGQDYRRGVITLDINTVGQTYSTFNGALRFDVNTLGIPTTVWGGVVPYIGNADYVAQYEYTIYNNIVWTNLLGMYPRIRLVNPRFTTSSIIALNSGTGLSNVDPSTYLRGSPMTLSWSTYSFFPYAQVGQPPFDPQVVVETVVSNVVQNTFGPFPFSQSSITITTPYLTGNVSPITSGTINMYVIGYQAQPATQAFNILAPTIDYIYFRNTTIPTNLSTGGFSFLGGYELAAVTDSGNYPLFGVSSIIYPTAPPFGSTGVTFFNMDSNFAPTNLFNNITNRVGFRGSPWASSFAIFGNSSIQGGMVENPTRTGFFINLSNSNYFPDLQTYSTIGGAFNFNLTNGIISTTLSNAQIRQVNAASTLYEVFTNTVRTSNVFSTIGNRISILYNISTLGLVSARQQPFVGPVGGPFLTNPRFFADRQAYMEIPYPNGGLSPRRDPISTLTFYNVISTPIFSSMTAGNRLELRVIPGNGFQYIFTISTTSSITAQTFAF